MPVLVDRIVVARLLVALFVFGVSGTILLAANDWRFSPAAIGIFMSLVAVAVLTTIYLLLLLRYPALRIHRGFLALQYVIDMVLIAVPVAMTEATSSVFITLYVFLLVVVAMTHSARFAMTMALLASVIVAAISYMEVQGVLPGIPAPARANIARKVLLRDVTYIGVFFVMALLPSGMATRLQRTDRALDSVSRDYALVRELHRLIVDQVPSGLALLDHAGRVLLLNRAGKAIFANIRTESPAQVLKAWVESGVPMGERRERGRNNDSEVVLGYAVVQLDPETVFAGHLIVFQDVTARKRLERIVEEQERLSALGQLAANFAHELRNPLAAISNSLQLMSGQFAVTDDAKKLLDIQRREVARLERLVSDFLRFARPSTNRCELLPVDELVHQIVDRVMLHPEIGTQHIELKLEASGAVVLVDPDLLHQALSNLLLNAAQWSPPQANITVTTVCDGDDVVISVCDRGPGIAREDMGRIFEPFYSRRAGGTGLGLAIVWSAMRALGGSVAVVASEPGRTEIALRLPRHNQKSVQSHA